MSLVAGIDYSTLRVDVVAIPLDPDVAGAPVAARFTIDRGGDPKDAQRPLDYQGLRLRLHAAYNDLEARGFGNITSVAVESPAGTVHPNLYRVHGALLASTPHRAKVCSIMPNDWRRAIGVEWNPRVKGDAKRAGNARVLELYPELRWDEHELDALAIARAWRDLQWKAVPA